MAAGTAKGTEMAKKLVEKAQDALMTAMQVAFASLDETPEGDVEALRSEMDRQMKRVEKLFGYDVGSWQRGC